MFPLQLLALVFIPSATAQPPPGETKEKEEEEENQYDLMFRRGDLLEVPRTLFTHFGIYLGGGRVAHFIPDIMPVVSSDQSRVKRMVTNTRLILGVLAKCGSVRVDLVEDFAYGAEIIINPMDKMADLLVLAPRQSLATLQRKLLSAEGTENVQLCSAAGEEVARRAEKLLGDVAYSLLWYNCEHFVMYCRYGTVTSFQTFQFCKTLRRLVLSRGVAKVTAVLAACLLLYLRAVDTWSVLLAVLLPFLIWMAS